MSAENKVLGHRWADEFWTKGDLSVADEIFHPDFVDNDPNLPGLELNGIEGAKSKNRAYKAASPDLAVQAQRVLADGDAVVVEWQAIGTHTGEVNGIPPTGNRIDLAGISILTIKDGKIAHLSISYDFLSYLVQVGAIADPRLG